MLRGLVVCPEAWLLSVIRCKKRASKHRPWQLFDFIRKLLAGTFRSQGYGKRDAHPVLASDQIIPSPAQFLA
jgi:hypothetical protein